MRYRLKIAEETVDLDVSKSEERRNMHVVIGDKAFDVRYQVISRNHFHMVVNGKATEAFVVLGDGGKHIALNGRTFLVQDADQLPSRHPRRTRADDTPGEVTPPMPAVVVRVLVKEGDMVKRGQGLIVVSAMKMETTLVAPSDGRVKKINTAIEAKVMPGDILVEIEQEVPQDE